MIGHEFPYSNLHDLNIDWILKIVKDFQDRYVNLDETFQSMLQQITTAGENAVEAINNNEETALEAIRVFMEQCVQALNTETTNHIGEIQNVTNNQLDAINAAGTNQIGLIDQDGTAKLSAISSAGTAQVNIINGLITTLPQTYEDSVNQLQIINAVLNQTYNYPPLVQGHYADANEDDSKTLVADNYRVSTLLSSGCASKKIKIQVTNVAAIIRDIIYWTGWGDQAVAHQVSVSTSASDEKTLYTYTFPPNATYFTIVFAYDYNMGTQILVSDIQVSLQWQFNALESIELHEHGFNTSNTNALEFVIPGNTNLTIEEGNEIDEIDVTGGSKSVATSHKIKDSTAREDVSELKSAIDSVMEIDQTRNLIDRSKLQSGYYLGTGGVPVASSGFWVTDFVPVEPSTAYYWDNIYAYYYAYYTEAQECIEWFNNGTTALAKPFTTPSNCKYIRFTLNSQERADTCWLNKTNAVPDDFGYVITAYAENYKKGSITNNAIALNTISIDKTNFIVHDDKTDFIKSDDWLENKYIENGVEKSFSGYYATKPIYLKPNTEYYYNELANGYYAFYAADGTLVEGHAYPYTLPNPFTIPSSASYGRFTVLDSQDHTKSWINTANEKPEAYGYTLSGNINVEPGAYTSYNGNEITTFNKGICIGDSLTEGTFNNNNGEPEYVIDTKYSFPTILQKLTNVETVNAGISGKTSVDWYDLKKNDDLSGFDFAIIQLGVNDALKLGGWTQASITAFTNIITKLKNENNNIFIFVSTIIPASAYTGTAIDDVSAGIRTLVQTISDDHVILLDMAVYGNTGRSDAYNCGHLSAYGYWRLAQDYKNYISYIMSTNLVLFREIQFIGTNYYYEQ